MDSLPIISVAKLRSSDAAERQQVADELGHACRNVGFFYVVDHGIPQTLIDTTFGEAKRFFASPLQDKQALSIQRSQHNRGYIAMADERLNPDAGADMKEAFNIGVDLPPDHPEVLAEKAFRGVNFWPDLAGWRRNVVTYFDACLDLGRLLHRGLSLDLGLPETFFSEHLRMPIATLRMLRYPAASGDLNREDGGAGTHTDYGNITLLATDGVAGLQVSDRDGRWIEAPHVAGAFVCNIGDCLMRWTNDTYVSTPHRVRPPLRERFSIAFFLEVDPAAVVDPRQLFPEQVPKYQPVSCAEYLADRLDATYGFRQKET
ncbi:isopenicillin N synthase family oxygenase [Ketobacter sp. MCCC 1A13808]|uniref:isopenicillin N synthase family dioxygenase n=1 Tax=Ketobacter sp. MCCC 1A13808 TaxID=2602738 RepID=UPI000F1ACB4C|nr:2-oxoglutarate and iron-dependent oxygenase domain-containing protein [Ketobacter sp. MCCC 1A13808]MVF12073.1 isopenicillin N synthase family oxygenase [Ketobacter sp. MCCC 1A13808]RLP52844.1 MAG: isopenicillin N synthase family oxygenase [Ketobacter sp.]